MTFPEKFTTRMKAGLGAEYPAFLESLSQPPSLSLRLHPLKKGERLGDSERVPWHPDGRYLPERPVFTLDPAFHAGAYYVQEASSMFLFQALRQSVDLGKKLKVLDLCAAPGGKATLLASAIGGDSFLLANEVIHSRIPALRMNVEKWGYPNVSVSNHDPADFEGLAGFFDVVVVDAPCSGEGLFRKDEAAIAEWSEKNLAICSARQRRIMAEVRQLIRPGGVMIYSTCTFNPEENEGNVRELCKGGNFQPIRLSTEPSWGIVEKGEGYGFYPHRTKGEGFFIAVLQKQFGEAQGRFRSAGLPGWQRLKKKELPTLSDWLRSPEEYEFFAKPNGELAAVPVAQQSEFEIAAAALKRRSIGLTIGSLKNGKLIPAHELALSSLIHPAYPSVELSREQALLFLKKEIILPGGTPQKGWTLAKFEGLNLGWMKVLDNRINNYLPNEWRIRMKFPSE